MAELPMIAPLRRWAARLLPWVVRHAGRKRTVGALAAVSSADYLLPMLPNEGMAVTLGLLQPRRVWFIAIAFAIASAVGAALLGWMLQGLADGAQRVGLQTFGAEWERVMAYVQRFGPATMLLAAVFPSPPRVMVAATVLSGVPVAVVAGAVFLGKLVLYAMVFSTLHYATRWRPGSATAIGPWRHRLLRGCRRCLAYRRWLLQAART